MKSRQFCAKSFVSVAAGTGIILANLATPASANRVYDYLQCTDMIAMHEATNHQEYTINNHSSSSNNDDSSRQASSSQSSKTSGGIKIAEFGGNVDKGSEQSSKEKQGQKTRQSNTWNQDVIGKNSSTEKKPIAIGKNCDAVTQSASMMHQADRQAETAQQATASNELIQLKALEVQEKVQRGQLEIERMRILLQGIRMQPHPHIPFVPAQFQGYQYQSHQAQPQVQQ